MGFECHPNTLDFPCTCIPTISPTKRVWHFQGVLGSFWDFITIFSFLFIWLSWVINLYEFSEPLHIRYGTQRNVVRQGCTSCIKINFLDGQVLFLRIYSCFDLLKLTKENHGFVNISNGIEAMQKFESFLLWNGTTLCSLHSVLQGYVINQC